MAHEFLIEAHGLSRRYGSHIAANDISLSLRKGEILGLLGPNGAGKSTTMKMLAGVLAPSAGTVMINGVSLADDPKRAKQSLGYLPELPPVYPELSVDEYLRYCASLHGLRRSERAAALRRAKQSCGLSEVSRRLIGNLSKGYQQRVGIAQAIIHRPAVVILDEPTVGLDPIQILEIRRLIKALGQEHGVILSSHILPEIQAVCARVMIIHRGRLVYAEPLATAGSEGFRTIIAGFLRMPAFDVLLSVPGVGEIETLAGNQVRITVNNAGDDPRAAIADAAAAHGWGLIELHAERRTLEEIFVELSTGDAHALQEAA
ncbi:MAG: ABC transporter ATP-binding protein [Nevskia sp.]|nr:ABC transporter ATP-binding protein [Nevskia sp.]